jgi:hypothetical protein
MIPIALLLLAAQDISVGAIRWDAWHGDKSEVGKSVERSLAPEKWHARLPFFAQDLPGGGVRIDGANQTVMDREIQYARSAGLHYWAFVLYGENDAMSLGLKNYLASTQKQGLRFCLIAEVSRWKPEVFGRIATLMARPEYQRTPDGRPLLYILDNNTNADLAIDRFRTQVPGNPYIVIQNGNPTRATALRLQSNADAIGAYAYQRGTTNASYSQLVQEVEQFWEACRKTGSQVVPIVMSGWDRRPRIEHPVPWEHYQQPNVGLDKFYGPATPTELTRHLKDALSWIGTHPDTTPAKAVLIYAWNENDEGGWLVPTRGDADWRLKAVREGVSNGR